MVPKNSLIAATTGRMLIRVCGVIASTSCVVMRSRTTRSMRERPTRIWFWISSPTVRRRRLPKWSMSSVSTGIVVASSPWPTVIEVSPACSRTRYSMVVAMSSSVSVPIEGGDGEAQLLVGLVAADLGQVVALVLEEQVLQQGLRALLGGRLARAQLAVDVEQGLVLAGGVVLLQRGEHRSRRSRSAAGCARSSQPSALSSTVTGWRRLRSMRTPTVSRLSTSNSSHAPRDGMILTEKTSLSVDLSIAVSK